MSDRSKDLQPQILSLVRKPVCASKEKLRIYLKRGNVLGKSKLLYTIS